MTDETREQVLETLTENAPVDFNFCQEVAEKFELKPRAVVAMATRNGIEYKRKERTSKTGEAVVSKTDLVAQIADASGLQVDDLDGLEKANKPALQNLVKVLG